MQSASTILMAMAGLPSASTRCTDRASSANGARARALHPPSSEVSMAAQTLRFRHVLCPTDFSPYSADALSHAALVCRALGAELTVAHVHPRELPVAAEFAYLSPAPLE